MHDDRHETPAERVVGRAAEGAPQHGRPLSRRARQTQRSVEAYLKAGVRPRWMERVDEIDHGIRNEKQRLARAYPALRRLRALRRALLPPSGARPGLDPRALPSLARRFRPPPPGEPRPGEGHV